MKIDKRPHHRRKPQLPRMNHGWNQTFTHWPLTVRPDLVEASLFGAVLAEAIRGSA